MIFIDGTWLYANYPKLAAFYGKQDFHVDYGKLPVALAAAVGRQLGFADVDVVRTYLFGSYAWNVDLRDEDRVQRSLDFFTMLKEEHHYEVETFPLNFRGQRLRREGVGIPPIPSSPKRNVWTSRWRQRCSTLRRFRSLTTSPSPWWGIRITSPSFSMYGGWESAWRSPARRPCRCCRRSCARSRSRWWPRKCGGSVPPRRWRWPWPRWRARRRPR